MSYRFDIDNEDEFCFLLFVFASIENAVVEHID